MYSVQHNNIFIILIATSFGYNGHYQVISKNLKKLLHTVQGKRIAVVNVIPQNVNVLLYMYQLL